MRFYITAHETKQHTSGCRCGLCDERGVSYGAALNSIGYDHNPLVVFYAASVLEAEQRAREEVARQGWVLVPDPNGEHGQAMVELVLLLPLLALLFLGTLDLGRAFHVHVALGNAARTGVLYAQQVYDPARQVGCPQPNPAQPAPPCHAIQVADVMTHVLAEPQGGLATRALTVTVCLPATCYVNAMGATPRVSVTLTYGEPLSVDVTSPFTPITPLVGAMARRGFAIGGHVYGSTFAEVAPLGAAVLPAEQTAAAQPTGSATATATATGTPIPTGTPTATQTPQPTATPKCTGQCAKATDTPVPVPTATPTAVPGVTDTPTPVPTPKCNSNGNGAKACPTPTP